LGWRGIRSLLSSGHGWEILRVDIQSHSNTNTYAYSDSDAHSHADADSHSYGNTETHADTETDACATPSTDTKAEPDPGHPSDSVTVKKGRHCCDSVSKRKPTPQTVLNARTNINEKAN
jgi:hypothetical protein